MPNIKQWWEQLKKANPKEYERRRKLASKKAARTKEAKKIKKRQLSSEFGEIRKNIDAKRLIDFMWHNNETARITSIEPPSILKMTKSELLQNIQKANIAISIREEDFISNYRYAQGDINATFDFRRDNFDVSETDSIAKLRHVFRMQQRYLSRKNTWDEYSKRLDEFADRVLQKSGKKDVTSEIQKENLRRRFFDLYKKALELYNGGETESKGSPIFAEVAEVMAENPDATLEDVLSRIEVSYERREEEERAERRSEEIDITDFFELSDDDLT